MLRYLTHPNVRIDSAVPIERWGLDEVGVRRATAALAQPWMAEVDHIVSSDETKARQTAEIFGSHLGLEVEVRDGIGENDRSSTGYLPPEQFEAMVDRFFASPEQSIRGWERAVDAQARIVAGLGDLLEQPLNESTVVVGHGGVGTLWCCWLNGQPISRRHDQPGQGHYVTVDVATRSVLHPWRAIDRVTDAEPSS